uniref:Odorant receptor n=2 Tax=Dendrolimus punctatus TaxID=238572 RepID=A0A2K8GL32_9NEOP|nr:Odorant Receptor 3-2 [Dendrolimus punctatus]
MMGFFQIVKRIMKEDTCVNLIAILNFLPTIAGFSLQSEKFDVKFWIIHTFLYLYVHVVGTVVYQIYDAEGFIDSINSFFNISLCILICNCSWWLLYKRADLKELLYYVQRNDDLVRDSGRFLDKQEKLLHKMKLIVLACYVFHFVDAVIIYIPSRIMKLDDFSVATCVGLEPLTVSPNREICMAVLAAQELTAVLAVSSYDAILLFLFCHITATFQLLNEDMIDFNHLADEYEANSELASDIDARLKNLIIRHSFTLKTVKKLQEIYNTAVGIGLGLDAISMCLFFVLPIDVCLNFAPLIYHSFFVFFLYCYQGQRLTTASERFEMSVYCCGWEKIQVKHQKSILLMLMKAQKPVIIYAASVVPLRLYTFASTMQSIYKFVAVFKL